MELEEKVKLLKEEFSSLPKILIKKTLCSDGINEDIEKCKQRLQEFQQIKSPSVRSPLVDTQPIKMVHDPPQGEPLKIYKAEKRLEDQNDNGCLSSSLKTCAAKQRPSHNCDVKPTSPVPMLGEVPDPVKMVTQSPAIIAKAPKRMAPDPIKPKPKSNVVNRSDNSNNEARLNSCTSTEVFPKQRSDPAKMTTKSPALKANTKERTVLEPSKPKHKSNVISSNNHSFDEEVSDSATLRMQKGEAVSAVKKNSPGAPKPKPKPHRTAKPVQNEGYEQRKKEIYGEGQQHANENKIPEASSVANKTQELEEKIKKLQGEFSSLSKVLARQTLCSDDVNGDIEKAKQRIQEFRQINKSSIKSPVATDFVKDGSNRDSLLHQYKPQSNVPDIYTPKKALQNKYHEQDDVKRKRSYNEREYNGKQDEDDWQGNGYDDHAEDYGNDSITDYDYDYEEDYNVGCKDYDDDFKVDYDYSYEDHENYFNYDLMAISPRVSPSFSRDENLEDYNDSCEDYDDEDYKYFYENHENDSYHDLMAISPVGSAFNNQENLFYCQTSSGKRIDSNRKPFSRGSLSRFHTAGRNRPAEGHFSGEHLLPNSWLPMPCDERGNEVTVHLVLLTKTCHEYRDVERRVRQTLPSQNIISISRIQNPFLYQAYKLRKQKMDKENAGDNERQLFHGTNPDNITKINTQGFDRSFSGSVNGAVYGNGVYFARDASYSRCYTSNSSGGSLRAMYLARVLVGHYCKGDRSMRKPPPVNQARPEILYDSMVDDIHDPSIFVVYYDNQCYPEYLIRF